MGNKYLTTDNPTELTALSGLINASNGISLFPGDDALPKRKPRPFRAWDEFWAGLNKSQLSSCYFV